MMANGRSSVSSIIGLCFTFPCLLFVQPCSAAYAGGLPRESGTATSSRHHPGSYCGVYCVYTAARMLGCDVAFRDLLKRKYVPRPYGSSLDELARAANDHNMYAEPVGNLTSHVLRRSPYLMILHVKSGVDAEDYDHYLLYYGSCGSKANLFDAPSTARSVPFHELASIWDGTALVISIDPIDLGVLFAPARKRCVLWMSATIALIALFRLARRRVPRDVFDCCKYRFLLSTGQAVSLAMVAGIMAFAYHFFSDGGVLANARATQTVQRAHAGSFIPKVGQTEVRRLLGNGAVLIDARFGRDYQSGHLDGAVNLPMDANDVRRRAIAASIPKNSRIVVYCQSKACKFAENVALWLEDDGFSHVAIYQGGWVDWVAKDTHKKQEPKS
jgi:rhodanese-related sulfurtransferase